MIARWNLQNFIQLKSAIRWQWIIIIFVAICTILYFGSKMDTSWAIDKACTEVKSDVYQNYGEIPKISGNIIYHEEQKYIVVVKYEIPRLGWKASCACLVYGYREDNCYVTNMTAEMSYNYNYEDNLEQLKALWALK